MEETRRLLERIKESNDLYLVALIILYLYKDKEKYSTLSELALLLEKDDFFDLLRYYEGQTIEIPDRDELLSIIRMILFYYYYDIKDYKWKEIFKKLQIPYDKETSDVMRTRLNWIRETIDEVDIPKELEM